jgi:hypothetical protein
MNLKAILLAAALAVASVSGATAATQAEQVKEWETLITDRVGPALDAAVKILSPAETETICKGAQQCNDVLGDALAKLRQARLLLDLNPAPPCLHEPEAKLRQFLANFEMTIHLTRSVLPHSDAAALNALKPPTFSTSDKVDVKACQSAIDCTILEAQQHETSDCN